MKIVVDAKGQKVYQFENGDVFSRRLFEESIMETAEISEVMEALLTAYRRIKVKRSEGWQSMLEMIEQLDPEFDREQSYLAYDQINQRLIPKPIQPEEEKSRASYKELVELLKTDTK